jgi:dolichyldiphosphatase
MVGCAAGALSAVSWFLMTMYLRRSGWVEWGLDTRLAEMLRIRDLVITEDLVDAGWARWEERRKDKQRIALSNEPKTKSQ